MHYYNVILLFKYFFYVQFFFSESKIGLCFFVKGGEKEYKKVKQIGEEKGDMIFYRKRKTFHRLSETAFFRVINW